MTMNLHGNIFDVGDTACGKGDSFVGYGKWQWDILVFSEPAPELYMDD